MLEQQALGSNNDAIALAILAGSDGMNTLDEIRKLDLARVTSLTRTKDGSLTINLADRLAAFKALTEYDRPRCNTVYDAIMYSVQHPNGA